MVLGGLLLMSVFTAWPVSIVGGAAGDAVAAGLANWWGTAALLPAIALMFPTVGILFPDERLPGPRWRAPVAAGVIALGIGTVLQTIAPWRLEGDFTLPNPLAIAGVPVELFRARSVASRPWEPFFLFGDRRRSRWSCASGARAVSSTRSRSGWWRPSSRSPSPSRCRSRPASDPTH